MGCGCDAGLALGSGGVLDVHLTSTVDVNWTSPVDVTWTSPVDVHCGGGMAG